MIIAPSEAGEPDRWRVTDSGTPAGSEERRSDLADHFERAFPDEPRGAPQDPFAGDPDLVLPAHVRPGLADVVVLGAVDLDVQLVVLVERVEITAAATGVAPEDLERRLGEAGPPAQRQELQL